MTCIHIHKASFCAICWKSPKIVQLRHKCALSLIFKPLKLAFFPASFHVISDFEAVLNNLLRFGGPSGGKMSLQALYHVIQ